MNKEQLIADIESKPQFKKWAQAPNVVEKIGDIEKWTGIIYMTTPEGYTNTYNVWFMVDTVTGEASYQNLDTLDDSKNLIQGKLLALQEYCNKTFHAYEIKSTNLEKKWAIVTTYTLASGKFTKQDQIVYKVGTSPITHAPIV